MRNGEHLLNQNGIEKEHAKGGDNMARHLKEFDRNTFESLCGLWCTEAEICEFLGTTDKTLNKWLKRTYKMDFSEAYKRFSAKGNISLRRAQYESAINRGNVTMQIWLGKQNLGQSDEMHVKTENKMEYDPLSSAFLELEHIGSELSAKQQVEQETTTDSSIS